METILEILPEEESWRGGGSTVITPGFIEELNNEGRLIGNKYADFEGTDQECDDIERMYNPYEGL